MPAPDLIKSGNRFSVRKCDRSKNRAHSVSIETECALARISPAIRRPLRRLQQPAAEWIDRSESGASPDTVVALDSCATTIFRGKPNPRGYARIARGRARAAMG